jgi:hypothetical protein
MWYPFKNYKRKIGNFTIGFYVASVLSTLIAISFFFIMKSGISVIDFFKTEIFRNIVIMLIVFFYLVIEYLYRSKNQKWHQKA